MAQEGSAAALPEIRIPAALTFAGLVAGLAVGIAVAGTGLEGPLLAVAEPVGTLWLQALKMTILPLVAGLLFTGIVQTVDTARAGGLAQRTLGYFFAVLGFSALVGIIVMPFLLDLSPVPESAAQALGTSQTDPGPVPALADFAASLIPENVVSAAANGAMLPFIIFIALLALASTQLGSEHRQALARLFEALAAAMMVVIGWILKAGPVGVFALALGLAAKSGAGAVGVLAHYIVLVTATGVLVLVAAYALGLWATRGRKPGFVRAMLPAQAVAISTQSSLASLPPMLTTSRTLGVRLDTAEFVLPLAVALFRATSPAMNLAVAIYAAHLAGVELSLAALVAGAGVALLVSLSTVSLPGSISFVASVGPIALAMGVPIEPLALLVAVEMIPDVMRTLGNVTMDVAVTAAVEEERNL